MGKQGDVKETNTNRADALIHSDVYRDLIKRKKLFFMKAIIFFICFYFALPVGIILFPEAMSVVVFHHLTIAWMAALLQFAMIWGLGIVYFFKAKQFDRLVEKLGPWGKRP